IRGANQNTTDPALRYKQRQPANFKLQTNHNQQISLPQLEQETGIVLDKVRVLISLSQRLDVDVIATNFLNECGHIRSRGDYVELLRFCACREKYQREIG